jgi:hypothetical protein
MVATSERKRCELPPAGSTLTHKYKGRPCTAKIVRVKALPAGRAVKYRNQIFTSLSAAAKAVTHYEISGPDFWHRAKTSGRRPHPRPSN